MILVIIQLNLKTNIIICIKSDLEVIKIIAKKFRKTIDTFEFSTVKHKTASFGVAIYQENNSLKNIITKANNNLYRVK